MLELRKSVLILSMIGGIAMDAPMHPAEAATREAFSLAVAAGGNPRACNEVIGRKAARSLAQYCKWNSSATHPPCNGLNRCQMMVDHLVRMCHGSNTAALPCQTGNPIGLEATYSAEDWDAISRIEIRD